MSGNRKYSTNQSLTNERLGHYWSQQEVASRLGTTPENVSRWERGVTTPGPYYRQKLCDLFEKTPQELGLVPVVEEALSVASLAEIPAESIPEPGDAPAPTGTSDFAFVEALASSEITQAVPSSSFSEPVFTQKPDTSDPCSLQEMTETVPSSKSVKEEEGILLKPFPLLSTGSFSWLVASRRSPRFRLLMLSLLLVVLLATGVLFWSGGLPGGTSKDVALPTANSGRSVTSPLSSDQAIPAAYGAHGRLALDDSLANKQTQGIWSWYISDSHKSVGCHFLNGVYMMKEDQQNYCLAARTDFGDFVYQIEMTILQGPLGGIIFRANDAKQFYYIFQVSVDGQYFLYRSTQEPNASDLLIGHGRSTAIVPGYQHDNVLAVKALGENLFLYVNFRLIAHIQDQAYTHGNVGVAIVENSAPEESEVTFRNAKVWTI